MTLACNWVWRGEGEKKEAEKENLVRKKGCWFWNRKGREENNRKKIKIWNVMLTEGTEMEPWVKGLVRRKEE